MLPINISVGQRKQYYVHKTDQEILGRIRPCASDPDVISPNTEGCPAVWVLNEPTLKTRVTFHWQIALCVWNYAMPPRKVMAQLGYKRALANGTGFGDPNDPRRNYITGEGVGKPDPQFDKDRTMSLSMLTIESEDDGIGVLKTFDGNLPPPMKPGKSLPPITVIQTGNYKDYFDDYLYNPRDNWEMFFALNIINLSGQLVPFDGGGLYPWFFNNTKPVCFFPHVSREKIRYSLDLLRKLPLGSPRVNPYTK